MLKKLAAIGFTAALAFAPVAGFAQATTPPPDQAAPAPGAPAPMAPAPMVHHHHHHHHHHYHHMMKHHHMHHMMKKAPAAPAEAPKS